MKTLEILATEAALEHLCGEYLQFTVQLLRNLRKDPENIVVEFAPTWDSYKFAIYGFIGTEISLMLNFKNLESLMRFVEAASVWDAKWVLHESMTFAPLSSNEKAKTQALYTCTPTRQYCQLRCFMCDELLRLPNEHLRAVQCDRFSVKVPLWTHC